jgi:hypothetical protein
MTFPTDTWQKTSIDQDASEAPEPGTYDVVVTDGRAFTSKAGNPVIVIGFEVLGGPYNGHQWDELRGLKTEGQIKAAKATCARLGVDVDNVFSLEDIEQQLKGCVGNYYTIDVKQNGDYLNTYVQGRCETPPPASDIPTTDVLPSKEEAAAALAAAEADDDIPF